MTLRVHLFSVLREKLGRDLIEVQVSEPASGRDLLDQLVSTYSEIAPYRPVVRLAVNEAYVRDDVQLNDGDEVALITPVSGG